jgi:hypothetical protein
MQPVRIALRHTRRSRSIIRTMLVAAAIAVLCGQMVLSFCRLTLQLMGSW